MKLGLRTKVLFSSRYDHALPFQEAFATVPFRHQEIYVVSVSVYYIVDNSYISVLLPLTLLWIPLLLLL